MQLDIDRILISRERIAERITELAAQIIADHPSTDPDSQDALTIVPILTGAMIFAGDLIRQIPLQMKIGLLTVSSYPARRFRTQGSQLLGQQLGDITGRRLLLIDDILDSGGTLRLVVPILMQLGAASVKTCVLLKRTGKKPATLRATTSVSKFLTNSSSATASTTTTTTETCPTLAY